MAQFKRDQKIFFISPLNLIHNNLRLRSHVPETEGRDFATLLACLHFIYKYDVSLLGKHLYFNAVIVCIVIINTVMSELISSQCY